VTDFFREPRMTSTTTQLSDPNSRFWNRRDRIMVGLLALCTLALYFRTRLFDFVEYDDHLYVYRNLHVLHGLTFENLRWITTAVVVGNWHPLTMLVELIIVSLFGPGPAAFHLTNALLHSLNVTLVFVFLRNCTRRSWLAFFTAALWGLHPLRVESVAWISELKDVLCGTFWLGCMLAYLRYSRRRTVGRYALVISMQALALLAKPMAATLSVALLLMDYWPIGQIQPEHKNAKWWIARIAEKVPLGVIAIADMAFALRTQRDVVTKQSIVFSMGLKCKNALISCIDYLRDIFFPHHLIIFYPHPAIINQTIPFASAVLAGLLLLVITLVVFLRAKSQPYLVVGWLWFLVTLIPVLGFVRLGDASHANRYTYLPSLGITMAVVWMIGDWAARSRAFSFCGGAVGVVASLALAVAASFVINHWQNTHTLFAYVREVQPDNCIALTYRIDELRYAGSVDQALALSQHAITVAPAYAPVRASYALALSAAGKLPEAAEQFLIALNLNPTIDAYWDGLGVVRGKQAAVFADNHDSKDEDLFREKALTDFKDALAINPEGCEVRDHMAFQLAVMQRWDDAIKVLRELIKLYPDYAQGQGDLADALRIQKHYSEAVEHYRAAIANGARNPDWEKELAWRVAVSPQASPQDVQSMVAIAKDACDQTHDRDPAALDAYAACLARTGQFDLAISTAEQAVAQANAQHKPQIAAEIQKRLARYQASQPYLVGE
jgi:tetratricopeptide (TPR) repeat protein